MSISPKASDASATVVEFSHPDHQSAADSDAGAVRPSTTPFQA